MEWAAMAKGAADDLGRSTPDFAAIQLMLACK